MMSTTTILHQGVSSLLSSAIIKILAGTTGTEKALDLLKQKFTFTHSEIAKNFQDSYGYALAAISSGLAANQRSFWRTLFKSNVESEFSQGLESELNQALAERQFGEVAQLGQQLERLQQIESVTQTHYAQFLDFSQRFADWAQLVNVQLTQVLAALPKLQA